VRGNERLGGVSEFFLFIGDLCKRLEDEGFLMFSPFGRWDFGSSILVRREILFQQHHL
jgi:hypothetical protein